MAGMAAAEAAPWQVVRLRGVFYSAEAHSSRVGRIGLRGGHTAAMARSVLQYVVCSASVCERMDSGAYGSPYRPLAHSRFWIGPRSENCVR